MTDLEIGKVLGRRLTGPDGVYEYLGNELPIWRALYRVNPWGPERGDYNAGQVSNAVLFVGNKRPRVLAAYRLDKELKQPQQTLAEAESNLEQSKSWPGAITEPVKKKVKHG